MNSESNSTEDSAQCTPATRFLRSARLCRIRDLGQLSILSELIGDISGLIHALQKERGASSIFLGSNGAQFSERLSRRIKVCRQLETAVHERLEHVDERLDRMSSGARFYARVAFAFHALDTLPSLREQIAALTLAPQDSIKAFTEVIGALLAVVFETADIAADPTVSRALIALVNFVQGKEYAGQERATAGAAFSRGQFYSSEHRQLQSLIAAQDQAFHVFAEFATAGQVESFRSMLTARNAGEVARMRKMAISGGRLGELADITAEAWYEQTTKRIDAMKAIETRLIADLKRLCADKLAEVQSEKDQTELAMHDGSAAPGPLALVMNAEPTRKEDLEGGVGLYTLDGMNPKPMRSLLDVVQAQSRRLHDVSHELESARTALHERKVIERAKGLLMTSHRISEQQAYALMRHTAMNQNKRIVEVAETLVDMAEILKT